MTQGPVMDQAAMSSKADPADAAMKKASEEVAKKAKKDAAKTKAAADKAKVFAVCLALILA